MMDRVYGQAILLAPAWSLADRHEPAEPPGTIRAWHLLARRCMNQPVELQWGKVPELTLWFWIIKIAATTLGETAPEIWNAVLNA
jgi:hypothetical protein